MNSLIRFFILTRAFTIIIIIIIIIISWITGCRA